MRIISGEFGGRVLKTVKSAAGYRPATSKVRQSIFSMLEARGLSWQGLRVVDMFAGSGSLGIEALSRGADEAWFIEKNKQAAGLIRENLDMLGVDRPRFKVLSRDLFSMLSRPPEKPFGLVFIDPPYGKDMLLPALEKALKNKWMARDGLVLAEVEVHLPLPAGIMNLELLTDRTFGQTRILLWRNQTGT